MAGLLDYDRPDPLTLGLLGFSQAISAPRSRGGGVAAALGAFPAGQMQAAEMRRKMEADELRKQMAQAQMENFRAAADERKASAEERRAQLAQALAMQENRQGVLSQLGPQPMSFRDASIAQTGNAPTGYTPPQQRQVQITPDMAARYVANGGKIEDLKGIMEASNFGREEVARVLERRGPDNTPEQVMLDRFGRPVGGAIPKPFEMSMQDIGGSVVPVNPYAPTALTKTMTPDGIASNQVALGNLDVSRQRFALDRAQAASGGPDANKPVYDTVRGMWVSRPNAANPTGLAVSPMTSGGVPLPPPAADVAKIETDLRKELNDLPQVKKFASAAPAYKSIVDAASRNNKQADINLVYGLAKLYDPESVVREGEYDTIAKSQTIPEWLKGQAASLTGTGGKLTPATRALILQEAEGRFNSYRTEYNAANKRYSEIARQRGSNPSNIVIPIAGDVPESGGGWSVKKVP